MMMMMSKTIRRTMAQALVGFLRNQYALRDGREHRFFAGCLGIFGHGNVAGIGQALQENLEFPYTLFRNEQAMVHAAAGFARMKNRLGTYACTASIGPGATNMVTGAALATINRLPVLLLPGDIFARRSVGPVLQQLESELSQDISVNDCFRPVSRYWDRINRADQLIHALPEAMRVLTSPSQTGAVTLALPQDTQAEAFDYPIELFQKRVWIVPRARPDESALQRAADMIRSSQRPLIVAGGGVIYSEATDALAGFAARTGIPVAETQAGKGSIAFDRRESVGAVGVTGAKAANILAREADLVIGIGTRYSDFTTASKTAFADPGVRFININVAELDGFKHAGVPLVGDALVTIKELASRLEGHQVSSAHRERVARLRDEWSAEVDRVFARRNKPLLCQAEVLGVLNGFMGAKDVIINAAGSAPGDLHKLWRTRDPKSYHVEYGYSCMGYEVPGGLGVKWAAPEREVYVLVGDGTYLMMAQDLATAVQENTKLIVLVLDNHGFASIGALSGSLGSQGFGTEFKLRGNDGLLSGPRLPIDYVANARSLGANAVRASSLDELKDTLNEAKRQTGTTVIVVETDREAGVPGYETWWDVPVAEVSAMPGVQSARRDYETNRARERVFFT